MLTPPGRVVRFGSRISIRRRYAVSRSHVLVTVREMQRDGTVESMLGREEARLACEGGASEHAFLLWWGTQMESCCWGDRCGFFLGALGFHGVEGCMCLGLGLVLGARLG